jgi:preprotein translocase subunit YajC
MNELKLILIGLPMIEIAVFIYLLIRKDKKVVKETREKIAEDFPGRYEESERPYYEYSN